MLRKAFKRVTGHTVRIVVHINLTGFRLAARGMLPFVEAACAILPLAHGRVGGHSSGSGVGV